MQQKLKDINRNENPGPGSYSPTNQDEKVFIHIYFRKHIHLD